MITYQTVESHCRTNDHSRKCINGKYTGCNKCVGYCQYEGHPGYLNEQLRRDHQCLEKNCFYYLDKIKTSKSKEDSCSKYKDDFEKLTILDTIKDKYSSLEGIKFLKSVPNNNGYTILYVTLSNAYPINNMQIEVSESIGRSIVFQKLDYDFDEIVNIILS